MKILTVFLILAAAALLALAGLRTYSIYQYNQKSRRRKAGRRRRATRRMDHLTQLLYLIGGTALVLAVVVGVLSGGSRGDGGDRQSLSGWQQDSSGRYYLNEDGTRATGWITSGGERYYLDENGTPLTGWTDLKGRRFYFNADGTMHTGWLELGETTYYFREDGSMARGQVEIDGANYFFTASGAGILLVNRWNPVPDGYNPELVELSGSYGVEGSRVDSECYEALIRMIDDCNAASPRAFVISSYRTYEYQTTAFNNKVNTLMKQGMTREEAEEEASTVIAVPGTSEHHLGLAVDIIDTRVWGLEEEQANLPAQKWLMENCWRYGFILRYPQDKIDSTGIIYEPWHYRYVGEAVAKEIHETGLTLEEYIAALTVLSDLFAID